MRVSRESEKKKNEKQEQRRKKRKKKKKKKRDFFEGEREDLVLEVFGVSIESEFGGDDERFLKDGRFVVRILRAARHRRHLRVAASNLRSSFVCCLLFVCLFVCSFVRFSLSLLDLENEPEDGVVRRRGERKIERTFASGQRRWGFAWAGYAGRSRE